MAEGRIAGFFPIGDPVEGQFIVAQWYPDPEVMEQEILKMADDFDNWDVPMQEAREVMIEDTRRHFKEEKSPDGDPWVALDQHYWRFKQAQGGPDKILVWTSRLEDDATSEGAWFVDERSIYFNEAALPPYGPLHQEGTSHGTTRISAVEHRKKVTSALNRKDVNAPLTAEEVHLVTHGYRGLGLPARPFIGASIEAIGAIQTIFENHMHKTIEEPWKEMGGGSGPIPVGPQIGDVGFFSGGQGTIIGFTKHGQPLLRTSRGVRFGRR